MANSNTTSGQSSTGSSTGSSTSTSSSNPQSLAYQLTSGKAYDPDRVYLDASDTKGHYEQVNVKLPPRLQHVVEILVADSDQLRSRQDFIRNALFHTSHQWATEMIEPDPLALQLIEAETNRMRTEMRQRIREEQNTDYKRVREHVDAMIEDQDWIEVNEEVDRVAILSEDPGLPNGVRQKYHRLWQELNDALSAAQVKEMRQRQEFMRQLEKQEKQKQRTNGHD